ncbi:hypothetical protein [Kordia jejudonensis]|uniref:hypothetical protein n=1 Tax=Kordia jejudonensis TaxID=1348245 RepID=UPI000629101F|nr:hypothetical protein [Kordia jejudonensis]
MKNITQFAFLLFLGVTLQISAQEVTQETPIVFNDIEDFELPTFSKLSADIASEYVSVVESLPNLTTIGPFVDKELRRSFIDENSTVYTVRNFTEPNSILPNISPKRFELRNSLNTIMFTGFDITQLHCNNAFRATGN